MILLIINTDTFLLKCKLRKMIISIRTVYLLLAMFVNTFFWGVSQIVILLAYFNPWQCQAQ